MKIEYLLERYFEGLTTVEEEAALRRFFISNEAPENLLMYKPLFVHFDDEIKRRKAVIARRTGDVHDRFFNVHRSLILWISGVAACAAIMTGSFFFASQKNKCSQSGNYVFIDGRCYTDAATVRSVTFKTLHDMAEDGDFLPDKRPSNVIDMVGNQLKEFDFLSDE